MSACNNFLMLYETELQKINIDVIHDAIIEFRHQTELLLHPTILLCKTEKFKGFFAKKTKLEYEISELQKVNYEIMKEDFGIDNFIRELVAIYENKCIFIGRIVVRRDNFEFDLPSWSEAHYEWLNKI